VRGAADFFAARVPQINMQRQPCCVLRLRAQARREGVRLRCVAIMMRRAATRGLLRAMREQRVCAAQAWRSSRSDERERARADGAASVYAH